MATSVQIPETRVTPAPVAGADIADPGPLGLAAFAATTFVLCIFNAGLMEAPYKRVVLPMALAYGGIAQVLAGMWEFKKNNTFGATAFTSYGAFWVTYAAYVWLAQPAIIAAVGKGEEHNARGVWLAAWTIFTLFMLLASFGTNKALVVVFSLLTITFILLTWGVWGAKESIEHLGGWFGLLTAGAAWYTMTAGLLKSTFGRQILPVGPISH